MTQRAILISMSDEIEEDVLIAVNGIEIAGFANICPYEINAGHEYSIELHMASFWDDYVVPVGSEVQDDIHVSNGPGNSFVVGKIVGDVVISRGIEFRADGDFREYRYLDGERVIVKFDRLDVHFR